MCSPKDMVIFIHISLFFHPPIVGIYCVRYEVGLEKDSAILVGSASTHDERPTIPATASTQLDWTHRGGDLRLSEAR